MAKGTHITVGNINVPRKQRLEEIILGYGSCGYIPGIHCDDCPLDQSHNCSRISEKKAYEAAVAMYTQDYLRPQKEMLLILIKRGGRCKTKARTECANCWVLGIAKKLCIVDSYKDRYKIALNLYVNEYGKDPDLLEVLI